MRVTKREILLLLCTVVFVMTLCTAVSGAIYVRPSGGSIKTTSDIEMMVGVPFSGGGHINWELTGETARALRNALIDVYDNNATAPGHAGANGDGQLSRTEVVAYMGDLDEYYLEDYVKLYGGVKINSYRLLNGDVVSDTRGLIGTTRDSTANIGLSFYFDSFFDTGSRNIELHRPDWHDALFKSIYGGNYEYNGTYEVAHSEYVVSTSAFTNPSVTKGDFMLIRTPAGEIYTYNARFTADELGSFRDTVYFDQFNFFESPLILFILLIILGYFVGTMPNRVRLDTQPKVGWLHITAKLLLLLMVIMTFIGSAGGIFISGMYLWILSPIFLVMMIVLSKSVYGKMPVKPGAMRPPRPDLGPRPGPAFDDFREETIIIQEDLPDTMAPLDTKAVQCTTCGEIYEIPETDITHTSVCPSCGEQGAADVDF